ncbi:unnamed protein product [Adineta steineri]|uniref:LamG-like jellyroll fold domain-containing protein n=1 Tax=Adineta steineri TaxID=433720 RepID=A0A814IL46_9BILA|nr:unnamed protein product [Adineta steineri]CAF1045157.1 unnamed protein product [Adineta steineri]
MDQSESMETNTNTDETSNSLPTTTEAEVMVKKKFTRVKFIIIVTVLILLLVGIPVSIVLTKKSDTNATKMMTNKVTTTEITTKPVIPCDTSCVNTTTSTASSLSALYLFDSNTIDYTGNYNGTPVGNPSYVPGYVGYALKLNSSSSQFVRLPSTFTFYNRSSTVELWINLQSPLYSTSTPSEVNIINQCASPTPQNCLFYSIRHQTLYQAFGYDDKGGTTDMSTFLGQWVHLAFTYDSKTRLRQIYLNGIPEPTGAIPGLTDALEGGPYMGIGAQAFIGWNEHLDPLTSYLNAYVDHFSISNRAKSASEIINDATLVTYFSFDSGSLVDNGPNMLSGTAVGQTTISSVRNQALSFTGNAATSYFQVAGLTALGTTNASFSFALYIKPTVLYGIIVHVSMDPSGTNGWCMPFIGFTSSEYLAVQVWDGSNMRYVLGPILTVDTWTHVVQTFSITNGLKLYINGTLYSSASNVTAYSASGVSNYLTIASTLTASISSNCLPNGVLDLDSYNGGVDELRVYNKELTSEDVYTLSSS